MRGLQPRNQLIAWLVLAGVGLGLFFTGEFRDIPLPLGWFGTFLLVVAIWFSVDAVHRIPHSDEEAVIAPGEWQAWIGVAFVGAVIAVSLLKAYVFLPQVPIGQNPDASAVGERIGTLFVAWLVLAHVLKQRWAGKVIADERDAQIELAASQWGRCATAVVVIGIALLLGFTDTTRLQQFSYPYIAQMLMSALLWGLWFDQLVAAILYRRDRRAVAE
ncbi:MAG: hypothetical protein M3Q51_09065 [Pseudomonadota bacterium]|nr:hypothetical protein [Pseudomonadota bacterium]MDQ3161151.1 hypothetical protein [Pseudomonadota bacterium]